MAYHIREGKIEDCPEILSLIKELADFEKAPHEMELSLEELEKDGFGKNPAYDVFVAEENGKVLGMALFYEKYSTWKGRSIYLEDLIVSQNHRKRGIGKKLFMAVMQEAKNRNSGRMEWQVLDWNQGAIKFYEKHGAELDAEWINCKFRRDKLQKIDHEGI